MNDPILPYSTAKSFCQGAFLMMASPDRFQVSADTTFIMPFHHLIGFSVELYLKSYLMKEGVTEAKLSRPPYGHSLQNLLSAARDRGFICEESDVLVTYLRPHETYSFRYMQYDSQYELQPLDVIFSRLSALDIYVDATVGASASRGLEIGGGWIMPHEISNWRIPS